MNRFAAFVGLATAVLPWNLTLAFSMMPIFVGLAFAFPHYATILAVFLAFGAVPSFVLPQFSFAGGTIRASELFLLFVIVASAFHAIKSREKFLEKIDSPYTAPFVLFLALIFISSVAAVGYFKNQPKYYLYELRVVFFWSILPLILYSISKRTTVQRFVTSMLVMGVLLSAGVIYQALTGQVVLEAARVESLATGGSVVTGVTRSTAGGGIYFILFLINYFLCAWAFNQRKFYIAWPLIIVGAAATLVTFGRAVWFAEAVAVLLLFFIVPIKQRIKIIFVSVIGGVALFSALMMFFPDVADAAFDRLLSVDREVASGESYQWRKEENAYALKALEKNPILGVGLGGEYQPFRNAAMGLEHTRSIHSSYYYLALKFGILGLLLPIWTFWISAKVCRRIIKESKDPWVVSLVCTLAVTTTTCYITSFTQMEWMHHTGVAFLATSFALISLVYRIHVKSISGDGSEEVVRAAS